METWNAFGNSTWHAGKYRVHKLHHRYILWSGDSGFSRCVPGLLSAINSLRLLILNRRSRPHSVSDYSEQINSRLTWQAGEDLSHIVEVDALIQNHIDLILIGVQQWEVANDWLLRGLPTAFIPLVQTKDQVSHSTAKSTTNYVWSFRGSVWGRYMSQTEKFWCLHSWQSKAKSVNILHQKDKHDQGMSKRMYWNRTWQVFNSAADNRQINLTWDK